jgi:hypothetical protein
MIEVTLMFVNSGFISKVQMTEKDWLALVNNDDGFTCETEDGESQNVVLIYSTSASNQQLMPFTPEQVERLTKLL